MLISGPEKPRSLSEKVAANPDDRANPNSAKPSNRHFPDNDGMESTLRLYYHYNLLADP